MYHTLFQVLYMNEFTYVSQPSSELGVVIPILQIKKLRQRSCVPTKVMWLIRSEAGV